jgi:hypothetical protein
MSTIRVVYSQEPSFPATDQHPDAVRYQVDGYFVDAIGGAPSVEEVQAVLSPAPEPASPTLADLQAALITKGVITEADVTAAAATLAAQPAITAGGIA